MNPLYKQRLPIAEAGLPGFEVPNWDGWRVPRGTPGRVVARLNAAMRQVLTDPVVIGEFARRGMATMPTGPEALGAEIGQRITQFAPIARVTAATPD